MKENKNPIVRLYGGKLGRENCVATLEYDEAMKWGSLPSKGDLVSAIPNVPNCPYDEEVWVVLYTMYDYLDNEIGIFAEPFNWED